MSSEKLVLSALVSLVRSDGVVSPEEQRWLAEFLERAGLEAGSIEEVQVPLDREALRRAAPDPESRRQLLRFLLLVSMADGSTCPEEWDFVRSLASDLEVPADQFEELRRSILFVHGPGSEGL